MAALIANTMKLSVGGGSTLTTDAFDSTGATLIVVQVGSTSGSTATVTDSNSNTYFPVAPAALTGVSNLFPGFYACVPTTVGSGHTVTVVSENFMNVGVQVFSGTSEAAHFTVAHGSGTTIKPGAITPISSGVIGGLYVTGILTASVGTFSIDSSFTITDQDQYTGGQHYGMGMAYKVSAVAEDPQWTASAGISVSAATLAIFFVPDGSTGGGEVSHTFVGN